MAEVKIRVAVKAGRVRVAPDAYEQLLPDDDAGILRDMLRRGQLVLEQMYREAPKDTGLLQATFRLQARTAGGGYGATVIAGREGVTDYLRYILEGTPPHEIRARRARALRFVAGGRVRFATRVRHPGTAANDFILRSLPAANR